MKLQLNVLSFLSGKGMKQFLLSLLATTISIVLTFGTSAVLEKRQKEAAKKEMVMMIIYDFDMTIGQVQKADSLFQQAIEAQQAIAIHLEYFDSLRHLFMPAIELTAEEYSETTEKIFSSNIETFSTIGNVNFLHEVSSFYNIRRLRHEVVKSHKPILGNIFEIKLFKVITCVCQHTAIRLHVNATCARSF